MASIFTFHQLLISSTSNMRAWSTPFLRPMAPFLAGGAVTFYLINAAQEAALKSEPFKSDPRNPKFTGKKEEHH
ncbi:MAG: ATP synthase j chain-domain-containing protein [Linnemannia elongata]|nr:MAG: ATP synthase j chain-domain-containing protein [Linnemannia elongata]